MPERPGHMCHSPFMAMRWDSIVLKFLCHLIPVHHGMESLWILKLNPLYWDFTLYLHCSPFKDVGPKVVYSIPFCSLSQLCHTKWETCLPETTMWESDSPHHLHHSSFRYWKSCVLTSISHIILVHHPRCRPESGAESLSPRLSPPSATFPFHGLRLTYPL